MRKPLIRFAAVAVLLAVALLMAGRAWQPGPRAETTAPDAQPVVVELFTSQGCSSCPPADAFLTELADMPGVIALSLHVDYWDYIGWADPFAEHKFTVRQQDYARSLSGRYVYTPQMVIDGRSDVVGSRRQEARSLIAEAAARPNPLTLRYEDDGDGGDKVVIPAGDAPDGGAPIWLAFYDESHETEILRGENKGKTLRYSNVVRELELVGTWDGREMAVLLDLPAAAARGRSGCAVIVQAGHGGPVLGAISLDLDEEH